MSTEPTQAHPPTYCKALQARELGGISDLDNDFILTSLQKLSLDEIPAKTRIVFALSQEAVPSLDDDDIVSIQEQPGKAKLFAIQQSSKQPSYSFSSGPLTFELFYEPGGDGVVLQNHSKNLLYAARVGADISDGEEATAMKPQTVKKLSVGPWRVTYHPEVGPGCGVILRILPRRYSWVMRTPKIGSKRKCVDSGPSETKRLAIDHAGSSKKFTATHTVLVPEYANPLPDLPIGGVVDFAEQVSDRARRTRKAVSAEVYSLSNVRNIVDTKAAAFIFEGKHALFGTVAVKINRHIKPSSALLIPAVARNWRREVRILERVRHPSIIQFYGSDARILSLYLEHVPYHDLTNEAWIDPQKHWFRGTNQDATRILHDIASALVYLKAQNILHNDIKPGNILYGRSRGAVLIDFGLASVLDEKSPIAGTPWYIPREFFLRGERTFESDIFALGVTLLYLLRKVHLPEREPLWAISHVRKGQDYELMMQWLGKVERARQKLASHGLEDIVKGMLFLLPADRINAQDIVSRTGL